MIKNLLNFFLILIIFSFFFVIYKYYSSTQNIQNTNKNRTNFEKLFENKSLELPVLSNDTNIVVEFNSGSNEEIKDVKPRSFWKLLSTE